MAKIYALTLALALLAVLKVPAHSDVLKDAPSGPVIAGLGR
ncbi:MAG: hypothetical protein AAF337_09550 [Pseudomonadota bacterium]